MVVGMERKKDLGDLGGSILRILVVNGLLAQAQGARMVGDAKGSL